MGFMELLILLKQIKAIHCNFGGILLLWVKLVAGNIIIQEFQVQSL
jgi:hypothetical protein